MIKTITKIGLNKPVLDKGMSAFWHSARLMSLGHSLPGRYRAALILENTTGFLRIKKDGIFRGREKFSVHPEVCRDLLQNGILQLRIREKASFEEWLSFLRTKQPTQQIEINMAIAPEAVRIWNPKIKGSSVPYNPMSTFPVLERMQIFSSHLFNIRLEYVELPNKVVTSWLTIDTPGAIEVVPVTEDGKIILIEQPRHTAPLGWEVPAGILEPDTAPEKQAAVELEQEAGYLAKEIIAIGKHYIFVGSCNQCMQVFLARGLTKVGQKLEEHESIGKAKAFSQDEVWKMIEKGEIRDSHTMVGIMLAMRFLNQK